MDVTGVHMETLQEVIRNRCNPQALVVVIVDRAIIDRQVQLVSDLPVHIDADRGDPPAEIDGNGASVFPP